jgi:hypothetical protein
MKDAALHPIELAVSHGDGRRPLTQSSQELDQLLSQDQQESPKRVKQEATILEGLTGELVFFHVQIHA